MLSMSSNSIARSSMEEMLDSLRRKNENERPKDMPPALPARPKPASRARLPSSKRKLPKSIENGESESSASSSNFNVKKEDTKSLRGNSIVVNRVKEWEKLCEPMSEDKDRAKLDSSPLGLHPRFRESEWDDNVGYFIEKIGALEDARNQVLQGTLAVQKCFRGHHARRYFHELKEGVITLQSFIRGEISRSKHCALLKLNEHVACGMPDKQRMSVVKIQSAIRRWLAKRKFGYLRKSKRSNVAKRKPDTKIYDDKDMPPDMLPSVVEELQGKVMMAEAILGQKERENSALRWQIRQFQAQWSEYEAKMKSLEEVWQKHTASLQMSLAAAKMNLGADDNAGQPASIDDSLSPCCYEFKDMSMGTQTPGGSTPIKFIYNGIDLGAGRLTTGGLHAISSLVKEFEERKKKFDDEARAIDDVTSGHSPAVHPEEELQSLKSRFQLWKKDYRARLREAKAKVYRLGQDEAEKIQLRWWGKEEQNILAF
ncbi:Myosin-2 [Abeliophyllum distichum]|uniref:Myosin-2 n=1 Tax=Abeliophyllum distichum TaxID=126358 RepID=A0ABD1QJA3_9LAMI